MYDVVVVGGGVIGLSIALELRPHNSVLLIDRADTGKGASWAAAGMLSPQSEADADDAFFQLCMQSLRLFPQWAAALLSASGIDPECDNSGLIVLASADSDLRILEARCRWQKDAGFKAEMLDPDGVRQLEPAVTLNQCGGLLLPAEFQVHPRSLAASLRAACERAKVVIRTHKEVDAVVTDGARVSGVRVGNETVAARQVVIAGGVWSSSIEGLSPQIPLAPRKGQILSVAAPARMFRHMLRWAHSYFVPRRTGELVIGATNEDVGFDRTLTPAGVGRLLAEAQQISSHVGSFPIREMWTGLRPATPDSWPVLGASSVDRLFYATGHYRNGILLAPITASIICALLRGKSPPVPIDAFSPARFA